MSKLYPPILATTIPAFCGDSSSVIINVPFQMNPSVSASDVGGFVLLIKGAISSQQLCDPIKIITSVPSDHIIKFTISESKISFKKRIGEFFKIQLAYVSKTNSDEIGFYSNAATIKCTASIASGQTTDSSKGHIEITNLVDNNYNICRSSYVGYYAYNSADLMEKVYSYCFNIYDENMNLIDTSGTKIHNINTDVNSFYCIDSFTPSQGLESNKKFQIQYEVTTVNGLITQTPLYPLIDVDALSSENLKNCALYLKSTLDFENGRIILTFVQNKSLLTTTTTNILVGNYKILRTSNKSNFQSWEEVYRFSINQHFSYWSWADNTIEQGVIYQYAIQQYNINNGIVSKKLKSSQIYSDFDHVFLSDGTKQLKIKFNPKIASFKTTLLESKMDTIGGKTPFFFRNGNVSYKEFSLSGLLSAASDENYLFSKKKDIEEIIEGDYMADESLFVQNQSMSNLTNNHIFVERNFKLDVIKWLENGELKLFRSPTEGNYIVRLMNISLSPVDQLGRMLHTFNATAYEAMDYNIKNLINLNILSVQDKYMNLEMMESIVVDSNIYNTTATDTGKNLLSNFAHRDTIKKLVFKDFIEDATATLILRKNGVAQTEEIPMLFQEQTFKIAEGTTVESIVFENLKNKDNSSLENDQDQGRIDGIIDVYYTVSNYNTTIDNIKSLAVKKKTSSNFTTISKLLKNQVENSFIAHIDKLVISYTGQEDSYTIKVNGVSLVLKKGATRTFNNFPYEIDKANETILPSGEGIKLSMEWIQIDKNT